MKPALIVIDCQNDFIKGYSPQFGYTCEMLDKKLIGKIKKLLDWTRKKRIPIIFTQHSINPDKSNEEFGESKDVRACIIGEPGWEIIDDLEPKKGELVIRKDKYDAFTNTNLDEILKKMKIDTVILSGVLTNNCVRATAEGAHYRNYKIFVVSDCTGGTSCNKGLSSKKVHDLTLEDLKGRMYETYIVNFSKLSKIFGNKK